MSDFNKKLANATSRIQEHVQQQKKGIADARQAQAAAERTGEEAISKAHGIAVQFNQNHIKPVMKQIQPNIRGGILHDYSEKELGFAGCSLEFGEAEYLSLKLNFYEEELYLAAEAQCEGMGSVHSEESEHFDLDQFSEADAQKWVETRIIAAYEAFGKHSKAVRNQPPIVKYNTTDQE